MDVLRGLEPRKMFEIFERICAIPHGSGNMTGIADFVERFAEEHRLEHYRDSANNIVIISGATPGRTLEPAIILQGHMDMVCAADENVDFDFKTQALRLKIEDGKIGAEGTSLGADDGIAVAMMLALLEDKELSHPRLECVFTTDEEIGLIGANALDVSHIQGRRLINLDSEDEGEITTGCAGGICMSAEFAAETETLSGRTYRLTVQGLIGGHSGTEIIAQRANANKVLARVLTALQYSADFRISCAEGGFFDNAIPRKAEAIFLSDSDPDSIAAAVERIAAEIKHEYSAADPGMSITLAPAGVSECAVLLPECQERMLFALYEVPDGIIRMCDNLDDMVETSLNLGILRLDENGMKLTFMLRSAVNSAAAELRMRLETLFGFAGGKTTVNSSYGAWEFRQDSPLRDHCVKVYEDMYGSRPLVGTIHAGLEAAVIASKLGDTDCVSIGPTLRDVHTSYERLDADSAARVYDYVKALIEREMK
ncbi:MAG: beta-Ala-His dipeptidase [Clostridia bacterium]|nr:beta-Ala-His dipeptidase [Clostridia bacterium]